MKEVFKMLQTLVESCNNNNGSFLLEIIITIGSGEIGTSMMFTHQYTSIIIHQNVFQVIYSCTTLLGWARWRCIVAMHVELTATALLPWRSMMSNKGTYLHQGEKKPTRNRVTSLPVGVFMMFHFKSGLQPVGFQDISRQTHKLKFS